MYGALICTAMSVLRGDDTTHVSFEASFVVLYVLRLDYAYISLSISLVEEGREKFQRQKHLPDPNKETTYEGVVCCEKANEEIEAEQTCSRGKGVETTAITATNSGQTRLVVLFA